MAITGYTFDRAKVTTGSDSSLYNYLSLNRNQIVHGRGNEMAVTTSGLTCTIGTGQALIQGRLVEITTPEQITIPANSTGYLCIIIDLSQVNSSTGTPGQSDYTFVIGQLSVGFVTTLTQDDLFNGGLIYDFNLGQVTSTDSSITFSRNNYSVYPMLYASSSPNDIVPNGLILETKDGKIGVDGDDIYSTKSLSFASQDSSNFFFNNSIESKKFITTRDTDFITVAVLSPFRNTGTSGEEFTYRISQGILEFSGTLNNTSGLTRGAHYSVMTGLSSNRRPKRNINISIPVDTPNNSYTECMFFVGTGGNVEIYNPESDINSGSYFYIYLNYPVV